MKNLNRQRTVTIAETNEVVVKKRRNFAETQPGQKKTNKLLFDPLLQPTAT